MFQYAWSHCLTVSFCLYQVILQLDELRGSRPAHEACIDYGPLKMHDGVVKLERKMPSSVHFFGRHFVSSEVHDSEPFQVHTDVMKEERMTSLIRLVISIVLLHDMRCIEFWPIRTHNKVVKWYVRCSHLFRGRPSAWREVNGIRTSFSHFCVLD